MKPEQTQPDNGKAIEAREGEQDFPFCCQVTLKSHVFECNPVINSIRMMWVIDPNGDWIRIK